MIANTMQGQTQLGKRNNESSKVLSNAENDKLFSLIGVRCQTMSAAVVQVFLADPPSLNRWNKRCCGVATLIKDNPLRSYFIRVYDIRSGQLIWEQELYTQFKYKTPRPHFHTFDTDICPAGLNFTDVEEARAFRDAVSDIIRRMSKKGVKAKPPGLPPSTSSSSLHPSMPKPNTNLSNSVTTESMTNIAAETKKSKKEKKDKKMKKLTKDDIGIPTGFLHLSHVGWDPNKGYDTNNLEPGLRQLFDLAGVSTDQLKDKETANFIYDFIENFPGGYSGDVLQPQAPSRGPGPGQSRGAPPPPPSRGRQGVPPPPPNRGPVPPPPFHPPPIGGVPPPPPPIGAPQPPPPPPPPFGAPAAPPPPPICPPTQTKQAPKPAMPSLSGALQDEIQSGFKLKPVSAAAAGAPAPADGRSALLNQIASKSFNLRPPSVVEPSGAPVADGLAGALALALAQRSKHIRDSDPENDSDDDDDEFDDWDD